MDTTTIESTIMVAFGQMECQFEECKLRVARFAGLMMTGTQMFVDG